MLEITKSSNVKKILAKEKALVSSYDSFEASIKETLTKYIEEFKSVSFENELLKTMLLNNFTNAISQAENNILNIQSLSNILEIIERQDRISQADVETYNKLSTKVDKEIDQLQNFLFQTISGFESIPIKGKKKSIAILNDCKEILLQKRPVVSDSDDSILDNKNGQASNQNNFQKIKKDFDFATSDLLCFFPKNSSESLVISTSQENYTVSFNNNFANIQIEDEGFNLSLKTSGVQITNINNNNVLFVSCGKNDYSIVTNSQIEIPYSTPISKISKNEEFLEVVIKNTFINICVEDGIINFENNKYESIIDSNKKEQEESDSTDDSINVDESEESIGTQNYNVNNYFPQVAQPIVDSSNQDGKINIFDPIPISEGAENISTENNTKPEPQENDKNEIKDNDTLIISDYNKNVILPYRVSDLEEILRTDKDYKNKTLQDVIENEYTIPIEEFKNPAKSRFREAFQLMKNKEHGSFKEAVELGFELMFQSDLNPAIIAACRDLDELDIYLDCLDDNELEKFSCFKIQYDIPPNKNQKK